MQLRANRWQAIFRIRGVVDAVTRARFVYSTRIRRRLRVYDDEHGVVGHDYSTRSFSFNRPRPRILKLIRPLSVIESLNADSKILVIGCRFESDMFYLMGYGFQRENIRGLDMVSYSPWVDLGNMHAMSYPDDAWDAVVCGWTLSYSDDPAQAAREIARVTKPGGIVAVGVSFYSPSWIEKLVREKRYVGDPTKRIQTVEAILKLFGDNVDRVIFSHDPTAGTSHGSCVVLFSIKKDGQHGVNV